MKANGFTLLELMVVITVSILLITVAIPGMINFVVSSQRSSSAMEFYTDLNLARSEAIARNQRITVCKSDDGVNCLAIGSGNWHDGWIVYVNKDGVVDTTEPDVNVDPDINEDILRINDGLPNGFSLDSEAADDLRRSISFLSSGRVVSDGGFLLCTSGTDVTDRRIGVEPSGRIQLEEQDCP